MGFMLKRRLNDAGLPSIFSPHTFRVLLVTDLLSQVVQYRAATPTPETPISYDCRRPRVTRNVVESFPCEAGQNRTEPFPSKHKTVIF